MAIGDYRYRLPSAPTVGANGSVNFDVFVEVQTERSPDVWALVDGGHFSLNVSGVALEALNNMNQLEDHIETLILNRGLLESDKAKKKVADLLGGSWPDEGVIADIKV